MKSKLNINIGIISYNEKSESAPLMSYLKMFYDHPRTSCCSLLKTKTYYNRGVETMIKDNNNLWYAKCALQCSVFSRQKHYMIQLSLAPHFPSPTLLQGKVFRGQSLMFSKQSSVDILRRAELFIITWTINLSSHS